MRTLVTAAACAALFSTPVSARSDDDDAPPAEPAAAAKAPEPPPPSPPAAASAAVPEQTLGFQLRAGGVSSERALLGAAFLVGSGPFEAGLGADVVFDVDADEHHRGGRHHDDDGGGDGLGYCHERSNGRCLGRADMSFTALAGLVHRTPPVFGGTRLRLDLLGEVGWQVSEVSERTLDSGGNAVWSDAHRAYPVVGARAGVGFQTFRIGYAGVGAFIRQSLGTRRYVTTDGGRTRVGGTSAGLVVFGGLDFGARR